jgi:hypothetical protein
MAQPDLRFFASKADLEIATTFENDISIGNVRTYPLYAERELINKIGDLSLNEVVFTKPGSRANTGLITAVSYLFDFGSFITGESAANNRQIIPPLPNSLKPDSINVATITSGNGDFLGSQGYVAVIVGTTPIREYLVYLTKK